MNVLRKNGDTGEPGFFLSYVGDIIICEEIPNIPRGSDTKIQM
jgi:hypothetical protein